MRDAKLYGILDMGYVLPENMQQVASDLLTGGVDVLQLRAKGYSASEIVGLVAKFAPNLSAACRAQNVPLIVNDFPAAAIELGADGVHIGQDDGSLKQVRDQVGGEMIVGRSTHSLEQAIAARDEGFDYIGFGPLFPTPTKQGRPGIGLEDIQNMQRLVGNDLPAFCIGGIHPENLDLVLAAGARRVVIVSALLQAPCICDATKQVKLSILKS